MEEVTAQVAPQFVIRHPMAKKRSVPFQGPNLHHHQQPYGWNPNGWDWDSVRFVAKPLDLSGGAGRSVQPEQPSKVDGVDSCAVSKKPVYGNDESLRLKLAGSSSSTSGGSDSLNSSEEPVSRPDKRVRSGSPGGGNYPMCQVDNCREDLSIVKDYHRRHKVCEVHSKSTKALVGKQMQRFCQQCSRFHPLSEFDEGKRSCRRRLAGHNRRRRKTQTEDVSQPMFLHGNHDDTGNRDLEIVKLLKVLAHGQGNKEIKSPNCLSQPNNDQLIQILSKINSLPLPEEFKAKFQVPASLSRTTPEQASSDNQNRLNANISSPSTQDLLAVLSTSLATSNPDALGLPSQRSIRGVEADGTKLAYLDHSLRLNLQKGADLDFPSFGGECSTSNQSHVEGSECQVQETRQNLPLQLFSSSPKDDSPPKLACSRKYFSSDSSNRIEEASPSSSPPVVQKLFPTKTARETETERIPVTVEANVTVETSKAHGVVTPLELFGQSNRGAEIGSLRSLAYQAGYSSSSGSDHSPSSLNSDAQDRTGRIIFKLFGKNPSQLPEAMRTQIYNWLSRSPSEMESYIRPGCVVLSIYVSMPSSAWEQLEENLLRHVNTLLWHPDTDFWRNGRFLVHSGKQLASHNDGYIRLCKSWRAWRFPQLISVSPVAVVGGQETSLSLRGRNLNIPGTKIHCTCMGGYLSKEVPVSDSQETGCDEINLVSFKIHGVAPGELGRFFIEVENGFKGTSFPVIIADATICRELRLLEFEIDEGAKEHDTISEDQTHDFGLPRSKEEVLHFLNELGWLFQRKRNSVGIKFPDYTLARFEFLFIFSIERDCCALVRTLLDILQKNDLDRSEPSRESCEMLSEIHLLSRAVKRRCRNMVDMLIHYSVPSGHNSFKYIFPPNLVGPGGITPLHLAACTSSSDDIIDALTSDPQEIGLNSWNSLLDANQQSPYMYALMRNNHSYNRLVGRKLAGRNGQVSVSIRNEIEQQRLGEGLTQLRRSKLKQDTRSCSQCAVADSRYNRRVSGSLGLLHRSYMHSMLAVAGVCVCVCLFFVGHPDVGAKGSPFRWENLGIGSR